MCKRQASAEIEITPEMIEAADAWLVENIDMIECGGSGDLRDLVSRILRSIKVERVEGVVDNLPDTDPSFN